MLFRSSGSGTANVSISGGGGGSGTVNSGIAGYVSYYPSNGTAVDDTSQLYWDNGNARLSVNAGGTFIPQYSLSAAPGGAYTSQPGSYFLIYPVGASGANVSVGTWA